MILASMGGAKFSMDIGDKVFWLYNSPISSGIAVYNADGNPLNSTFYRRGSLTDQCKLIDRFGPEVAATLISRFLT